MPITIETRKDYVENVTMLSLWLAQHKNKGPGSFNKTLTAQSPLYRLTCFWDGVNHPANPPVGWVDKKWEFVLRELKEILKSTDNADEFEQQGLKKLWPFLEPRIKKDAKAWPWIPSGYTSEKLPDKLFGFFAFELLKAQGGNFDITLHMGNIFAPQSPFKDMAARKNELLQLLDYARDKYGNLVSVFSGSWLNSFAPFLALFPDEWIDKNTPASPINYSYDIWGQLVSRTGGFHRRNAYHIRRTGRFPYPSLPGKCKVESLRKHLKTVSF